MKIIQAALVLSILTFYPLAFSHADNIPGSDQNSVTSQIVHVYHTFIEGKEGNILKLKNGGAVKVPLRDLWHATEKKCCLLFKDGGQWKLWIKRQDQAKKHFFDVELVEEPELKPVQVTSISEFMEVSDQHN